MPIYLTRCETCGHEWDVMSKYSDPVPPCPECSSTDTKRRITGPKGIHGGDYKPYDALDRYVPQSKPIKSFANDRRRRGRDTTGS